MKPLLRRLAIEVLLRSFSRFLLCFELYILSSTRKDQIGSGGPEPGTARKLLPILSHFPPTVIGMSDMPTNCIPHRSLTPQTVSNHSTKDDYAPRGGGITKMASKQNNQEKRKSAMRTAGEGVPERSAVAPRAGKDVDTRNLDERVRQKSTRKKRARDPIGS
jgi:hypothetical protein